MINATNELLFSEYFFIKAVLGEHLDDDKKVFNVLSKIFLIPQEQTEKLYGLAENAIAKSIKTESEFMRYQRMQRYSEFMNTQNSVSDEREAEWQKVANVKGNAILLAHSSKLKSSIDTSMNAVHTALSSAAACGQIISLRITGILQCEGIFFDKNVRQGIKNLKKAALWNDKVSALALLYYDATSRKDNMARLSFGNDIYKDLYNAAAREYGVPEEMNISVIKLINKAFGRGILRSDVYDPRYARILNSAAIHIRDKERAVFSQNAELVSIIGDLPLKLNSDKIVPIETAVLKNTALRRDSEIKSIVRALNNSDIRKLSSFRPICLCCDLRYVLNMYAKAIGAKSAGVHVEFIDVAELLEYDLEPTKNNIFVRSVEEDKDNRFLLFFCGDISERKMDAVKGFLQSGRRTKFFLNSPGVELDLSAVLPICFCDIKNAQSLEHCCDIIKLSEITVDELSCAIADILSSKAELYGVGKIEFDGDIGNIFSGLNVDAIEKLIDQAVRDRRESGATIVLTREIIREYSATDEYKPRIGFGGISDDRNK